MKSVKRCQSSLRMAVLGLSLSCLGVAADADAAGRIAIGIDPAQPGYTMRSRLLTGNSSEGTFVEAYSLHGHYRQIVVEELEETGRVIRIFSFDHDTLVQARVISVVYKGYPNVDLAHVPPHKSLVVDPTDRVLADDTYDFADGHPVKKKSAVHKGDDCGLVSCELSGNDVLAQADQFKRLMDTPPRTEAGDQGEWACNHGANSDMCTSFTQE